MKDKPTEAPRLVKREPQKEEKSKPEQITTKHAKANEQDSKPLSAPGTATTSSTIEHIQPNSESFKVNIVHDVNGTLSAETKKDDASTNLPPAASKHLLTKVELAPSESAADKPLIITDKKTLEKHIDVPLNLVGLLLSRKPQLKVNRIL